MKIHAFTDSERLARRVAKIARAPFAPIAVHRFPDGETVVRVSRTVGRQAVVVRSLDDPNAKLIEVLLAADALRRAGARSRSYLPVSFVHETGQDVSVGRTCFATRNRPHPQREF